METSRRGKPEQDYGTRKVPLHLYPSTARPLKDARVMSTPLGQRNSPCQGQSLVSQLAAFCTPLPRADALPVQQAGAYLFRFHSKELCKVKKSTVSSHSSQEWHCRGPWSVRSLSTLLGCCPEHGCSPKTMARLMNWMCQGLFSGLEPCWHGCVLTV